MRKHPPGTREPESVDEYLALVDADKRAALEALRRTIHAILPGAEECLSYRMPAFRHDGKVVVWIGAAAKHCAFYPGDVLAQFSAELAPWATTKGTVRFPPDRLLPKALVRKLIRARQEKLAREGAARPRAATVSGGVAAKSAKRRGRIPR